MKLGLMLQRLRRSFVNSAGTVVFGMEDGTVSIFGLIFGVAATTSNTKTVLIAGASGAVAAAVSMMAGAYLDIETTRDKAKASRLSVPSAAGAATSLPPRLAKAGLSAQQANALTGAVKNDPDALGGLWLALDGAADTQSNPVEQALWMLFADFLAASVPIVPFVILPVAQAQNRIRRRDDTFVDRARGGARARRRARPGADGVRNRSHRRRRGARRCWYQRADRPVIFLKTYQPKAM